MSLWAKWKIDFWYCAVSGDASAHLRGSIPIYRQDLVHLAIALLNDTGAAEDVVHDVFVGFAQGLSQFRLPGY